MNKIGPVDLGTKTHPIEQESDEKPYKSITERLKPQFDQIRYGNDEEFESNEQRLRVFKDLLYTGSEPEIQYIAQWTRDLKIPNSVLNVIKQNIIPALEKDLYPQEVAQAINSDNIGLQISASEYDRMIEKDPETVNSPRICRYAAYLAHNARRLLIALEEYDSTPYAKQIPTDGLKALSDELEKRNVTIGIKALPGFNFNAQDAWRNINCLLQGITMTNNISALDTLLTALSKQDHDFFMGLQRKVFIYECDTKALMNLLIQAMKDRVDDPEMDRELRVVAQLILGELTEGGPRYLMFILSKLPDNVSSIIKEEHAVWAFAKPEDLLMNQEGLKKLLPLAYKANESWPIDKLKEELDAFKHESAA